MLKRTKAVVHLVIMELEIQNINTDINFLSVRNLTIILFKKLSEKYRLQAGSTFMTCKSIDDAANQLRYAAVRQHCKRKYL